MNAAGPICVFDGHCLLCSGAVRFVLRHERRSADAPPIRFAAIQSPVGRVLALRHGVDPDDPDTFLVVEGDDAYPKAAGVTRIARRLGAPWRFVGLMRFLPRVCQDFLYDRIARNRFALFGRREACLLSLDEAPERFIASIDELRTA